MGDNDPLRLSLTLYPLQFMSLTPYALHFILTLYLLNFMRQCLILYPLHFVTAAAIEIVHVHVVL